MRSAPVRFFSSAPKRHPAGHARLPRPLLLIITDACNLRCRYCHVRRGRRFLSREAARKAVSLYMKECGGRPGRIKFFGGEPFLHFDLIQDTVRAIRQKSRTAAIEIATNGTLLDQTKVQWLKDRDVALSVSLDGSLATHVANRGAVSRQQHDALMDLVRRFSRDLTVNMTVAAAAAKDLYADFFRLYRGGARRFNFLPAGYLRWSAAQLDTLENQFFLIACFLKAHPDVFVKNVHVDNDLFLYHLGYAVDCDGGLYASDIVATKPFEPVKAFLRTGFLDRARTFGELPFARKERQVRPQIEKVFGPATMESTRRVSRILDRFVEKVRGPEGAAGKRLDLKVGYACNNACLFCVQGDKRRTCAFRSTAVLKKELTLSRATCSGVVFTGGEPTLHPAIIELVRHAKALDYRIIQIQTNGRMFAYRRFCEEMVRAGANQFCLALHAPDAAVQDHLTSSPGSFRQTVAGIRHLRWYGQEVLTNTVVTALNYRLLPRLARLFVRLGVVQFQFAFVHIGGSAWKNRRRIVARKTAVMPFVRKGLALGVRAGRGVMTEAIPYCFMRGVERYVAEQDIPFSKVVERNLVIRDYTKYRQRFAKMKGRVCRRCVYDPVCEGPWREYPELFGWSEFKPLLLDDA